MLRLQAVCSSIEPGDVKTQPSQGNHLWHVSISHFSPLWMGPIYPSLVLVRALKCSDSQRALKHITVSLILAPTKYKVYLDVIWGIQSLPDCIKCSTKIVLETKEGRYFASSKVGSILMLFLFSALLITFGENKYLPIIEGSVWDPGTYLTGEVG